MAKLFNVKGMINVRIITKKFFYYMKSPKLPVGPVGKFRLLGGAAPLSS